MAEVKYTEEQRAVLDAEGKIIVSASAGSGKTFVMIERMLRKILSGAEVERMLAVTFTKKAAAQMREKIQKSIIAKLNDPTSAQAERDMLKRQLSRLPVAEISTIHSFCAHLIRSHFFLADVDGAFEIMSDEDADGKNLQAQAIDKIFTEAYETGDENFMQLLDFYYRKKKDDKLKQIVLDLYSALRVRADYREVLQQISTGDDTLFSRVTAELLVRVKNECAYIAAAEEELLPQLENARNKTTVELIRQILSFNEEVQAQKDYFDFCALPMPEFKRKESIRKAERAKEKELVEKAAYYKSRLTEILENHLSVQNATASAETEKQRFFCGQNIASFVADLVLKFDDEYTRLKRERAKLDYNDLEHIALRLLSMDEVAKETREKFDYVFVDEYQDVNPVQEKILSVVGGENVFLVGDVKQSIYAFRGGKSIYFLQKQSEFEKDGRSLFLTSNFRSADAVLSAVNRVFTHAMTSESCGVNYAAKPMRGGGGYGDNQGRVKMHLLSKEQTESREKGVYSVLKAYNEARFGRRDNLQAREILNIIEEELHEEYYDLEEKKFKKVTYGDIAVLSRKKKGDITDIVAYLSENGIPVSSASKVNICSFPEVRQLIDVLSLIDNREQDVALCSALLSAMGGLTNADLAALSLFGREEKNVGRKKEADGKNDEEESASFRDYARAYAENKSDGLAIKLKSFYAALEKYVMLSHVLFAGELIERLIAETGMETEWLSLDDGERRLGRIRSFALLAQDKNVHDFLLYIKSLDYDIPVSENAGDNAVKVLTMHASKGLEYPVVILVDLDANFHGADKSEMRLSEKYGVAPRCYDAENKLVYETLLRRLIRLEEREEEIKNELNLLYVAMTRAKYSLHLVMSAENADKYADPLYAEKYAHFLPRELFLNELSDAYPPFAPFEKRQAIVSGGDESLVTAIDKNFGVRYAYTEDIELRVKSSASDILKNETTEREYYDPYPLVSEEKQNSEKTLVGTAYHAFLEHATFGEDGAEELERMKRNAILPKEQLALLSETKTKEIMGMPVFNRLKDAVLYREQAFLVTLPACAVFNVSSQSEVLFQGFIDLLAIGKDGVEIVDYKYSSRNAEEIRKHYTPQIMLYKKAVAKIMKISEATIKTTVINIQRGEEIFM